MEQNLEPIRSKIYEIRGQRVMSSHHTDKKDLDDWKSQFATSNFVKKGLRKLPYAFTENGVAMLSSVLRSPLAIQVNIGIEKLRNLSTVAKFAIVQPEGTVKEYLTVQTEGNRNVIRKVKYYNLDVIISVGYRVKSKRGTKSVSEQLQLDIKRHNEQYTPIEVQQFNKAHDRFLLTDDEVYHIGASIKDLGKKWFAFTLMHDIKAAELINKMS